MVQGGLLYRASQRGDGRNQMKMAAGLTKALGTCPRGGQCQMAAIQTSKAGLPGVLAPASESPSRTRFIVPVVCRWQSHQELAGRLVRSSRLGSGILDGVLVPIRVCARLRCLFGSDGPTLSAVWRDKDMLRA